MSAGDSATYTLEVTWTKQQPASISLDVNTPTFPASDGCQAPTTPPAHTGPGHYSAQFSHTWEAGHEDNFVNAVAITACQYYRGSAAKQVNVTVVEPSPTPEPTDSKAP